MDYDGNIDLLLAGSDDELVEEVQDLLIAEAIERFRMGRSACRLFKVHNEKVDWSAHVNALRHLKEFTRTYRIPYALPRQVPPALDVPERPVRTASGVYVCGDHRDNASINGAMVSGRRAAEAVLEDLR